ncbi:MAG: hypothetical protein QM699_05080 [Amaricoccus sp.]|uniref:hypothetical protein n=1 Tax=Amaricoccus sp. TaxID=1872485 RepID=UPI0039E40DE8
MTKRDISEAGNPDLRGSMAAMRRAAQMARDVAIQTDTGIVVAVDGKPRRVTAKELRAGQFQVEPEQGPGRAGPSPVQFCAV